MKKIKIFNWGDKEGPARIRRSQGCQFCNKIASYTAVGQKAGASVGGYVQKDFCPNPKCMEKGINQIIELSGG